MADFNPLTNHAVQTSLNNLFALEDNEGLSEKNGALEPVHRWSIDRVFEIGHEAQLTLERLPAGDMNLAALDGLANSIQTAVNELNAFLSNNNTAHINNARNQAESGALVQTKRLLPIGFAVHPKTEGALEAYKRKAASAKKRHEQEIKALKKELQALSQNVDTEKAGLTALKAEVEATRTENETLVSELRGADISRVESANSEAKEAIVEREKRLEDHLRAQERKAAERIKSIVADSEKALSELSEKKEEASQIVQSVGDLLTTGTYADRANKETQKADAFRYITVGLFAFGLLIIVSNYLIYAFGAAFGEEANLVESWQSLAARLATGLAVTLPAFYTARESARHRTNADVAKQRELELTTLGPFIELLPEQQKSAIRDRLTDRYFGGEIDPHDFRAPIDINALAKTVAEVAKTSGSKASID